jgi:hypothetical protein
LCVNLEGIYDGVLIVLWANLLVLFAYEMNGIGCLCLVCCSFIY